MPGLVCTARASYKKSAGVLELTDSHLQWTADGKTAPAVRVAYADAASLFCSKEGAAQVRLKLGLLRDDAGHNFTFTAPPPAAAAERERFKKAPTALISRNRAHDSTPAPRPIVPLPPPASRTSSPVLPGNDPANDFRLRKLVLLANPDLAQLHRDLVIAAQITEAEFWDGREVRLISPPPGLPHTNSTPPQHLLLAQAAAEAQKKGKPGQLVDPRPEAVDGGEIKIRITPQLVHDIFDEYPVVAKAYSDNVPNKARFFPLFITLPLNSPSSSQKKASGSATSSPSSSMPTARLSGPPQPSTSSKTTPYSTSISKRTMMVCLASCLFFYTPMSHTPRLNSGLEPRRQRNEAVDVFVNLAATLEDHDATGNEKDITMQAGRQKGALPLIRKFNEHSERLLNSALCVAPISHPYPLHSTVNSGTGPAAKRPRIEDDYSQIELDDLRDSEASTGIVLEMQDRQRYFEGRSTSKTGGDQAAEKLMDVPLVFREARANVNDWKQGLSELKQDKKAGDAALLAMTQNVHARLEIRSRKNDIPDGLFRQMTTCQTAANEFLRQFWSAMYPPPVDVPTLNTATPAQRATKAAKMIGYAARTREKVEALVAVARTHGVDPARVETALKPVLSAVDQAVAFHQRKMAGGGRP
ncbi:hypothetical protein H0H87_005188 [Tephrocybe sp. NHM501043]|nr:hypothetical protein H0H87_005188 [Tephrocybe sp. NHM501043]